ncbi:MAG TPA: acyltransferase [Candidatus Competibacteraceae bacterium]|nr:acyltransferase [Candidatus Competibacteraceae bacterium]MCP5132382.1 acyltransferase [Gammaproteobacteria bacterium]HRY17036.1 acyltransferase [Candidatus Competibacteraceae bacterium]
MSFYSPDALHEIGFLSVGENVKVSTKASIYGASRISLGAQSRIDDFCVLSAGEGGIQVGRNVHIAVMCSLIGKGQIELYDFCNLSSRVSIYSSSDDYSGESMTNPTIPEAFTHVDYRPVVLERHVIIGSGSVILPGVTIGEGTAVGALCLVAKSLEPFGIYAGSPLKRIKSRSQRLLELEKLYLASSSRSLDL